MMPRVTISAEDQEKISSYAMFLPMIYGISSPMTTVTRFWRFGPVMIQQYRRLYFQEICIRQEDTLPDDICFFKKINIAFFNSPHIGTEIQTKSTFLFKVTSQTLEYTEEYPSELLSIFY
jgi:hypothetical protein